MSSSDLAVSVRGISKMYEIGGRTNNAGTLAESAIQWLRRPFGAEPKEFWALRDVSFDVRHGEVVGIIGRNGAGKSTLLKILSQITEPTEGEVRLYGRVGSLLEVGTGFHPELTGRENIFLNGAILGMTRNEIRKHFDQIVAFAEVEQFLETPVKRYSSGMYVRLAFAVAAHLNPDILIVDEVLAVGDAAFQKKCLGQLQDVAAREGRSVLFVSHSMPTVRQLCPRAVLISGGKVVMDEAADRVVRRYLDDAPQVNDQSDVARVLAMLPPDPSIKLTDIRVMQQGNLCNDVVTGKPIDVDIDYQVLRETAGLRVFFAMYDVDGSMLFRSFSDGRDEPIVYQPGSYRSRATSPADLLAPIRYRLGVSASVHNVRVCFPEDVVINVQAHDDGKIKHAYALDGQTGVKLAPWIPWSTQAL